MQKYVFGKAINGVSIHFVKDNAPETEGFTFAKCDSSLQIKIDPDLTMANVTCARCRRYKVFQDFVKRGLEGRKAAIDNSGTAPFDEPEEILPEQESDKQNEEEARENETETLSEDEEFDTETDIEDYFLWLAGIGNNKDLKIFCEKNLINGVEFESNFLRNKNKVKAAIERLFKENSEEEIPMVEEATGKRKLFIPIEDDKHENFSDFIIDEIEPLTTIQKQLNKFATVIYSDIQSQIKIISDKLEAKEHIINSVLDNVSEIVGSFNDRIEKIEKALRPIQEVPNFIEVPSYKDELKEARKSRSRIMGDDENHFELVKFGEKINVYHIPSGQYMFSNIDKIAAETVIKYLNNLKIKWGNVHTSIPKDFVKATVTAFRAAYASHHLTIKVAPEEKKSKRVLKRRSKSLGQGFKSSKQKRVLKRRVKTK